MRTLQQEIGLFRVTGQFFFDGLDSLKMGQGIEGLRLPTAADTSAWKRFLDLQGEGIDTNDVELLDFSCLPTCDHQEASDAFTKFSSSPSKATHTELLGGLTSTVRIIVGHKDVDSGAYSVLNLNLGFDMCDLLRNSDTISTFHSGNVISIQISSSSTSAGLSVPGKSNPLSAPGRASSPSLLIPTTHDQSGSRPRRSGRPRSPNALYKKSYALDESTSNLHERRPPSVDDDDDEVNNLFNDADADEDDSEDDFCPPKATAPRSHSAAAEDEDDGFSQDSNDTARQRLKGKRKAVTSQNSRTGPSKKLKASALEERVFEQVRNDQRGRSRTVASTSNASSSRNQTAAQGFNQDAAAANDAIVIDDDEDPDDGEENVGHGSVETVAIRLAAKERWPPLKTGAKEWRHDYINKVQSVTVLYYFDLMSRAKKNGEWILTWKCRCCGKPRTSPEKGYSNLSAHIRGKAPKACHMRTTPCDPAVRPWKGDEGSLVDLGLTTPTSKPESAVITSTRRSMDNWRSLVKGQAAQKQTIAQRRAVLVWVIMTSQPFIAPSNQYFRRLWINDDPQESALKSPRTLVRDMEILHQALFLQAITALRHCPGRFSLQHDSWTTPSRREAFLAVHATWIDAEWKHRSACIGFERLGIDHTGAAFAGHLAGLLDAHQLWTKWSGIVVSDAAESNVRAIRFIEREITSDKRSLPVAVRDQLLPFSIRDNVVLCFAHGLNRAVIDGTAAAGAHTCMVLKDPNKTIRPTIFLDSTAVGGTIQRLDENPDSAHAGRDSSLGDAPQATATTGQTEASDALQIDREFALLQDEMDELMEEVGESGRAEGDHPEIDNEAEEIAGDYNADYEDEEVESAITKLHKCLVKIRSSTKHYKTFKQIISECYPNEKRRTIPSLRGATRWNSFLIELRGCVRIQKAFARLVNDDEDGTWEGFRVRAAEWLAMEQLCQVLRTAEIVSLDVQHVESSIVDVLFFHRILQRSLDSRLNALSDVDEASPAYGVKKAIYAIQAKLEKYENKARANKMIVAASLLHPKRRRRPLAQSPDGESPSLLLSSMTDRFVGKESVTATTRPRVKPMASRYGVDIDSDDDTVDASPNPSTSEMDVYMSGQFEWDSNLAETTEGALTWWKRHAQFLPRLAKLAQVLLAVPSTTAIAERGFSHSGIVCSPRRNLGPNSITMLTTCKLLTLSGFDPYSIMDAVQDTDTPARNSAAWTSATSTGPSISQRP
ncbi:hypothetical protein CF319_g7150 [Tilletia indica]|nr:hypothetical protein CF319_g7150 [Tilletia indica]